MYKIRYELFQMLEKSFHQNRFSLDTFICTDLFIGTNLAIHTAIMNFPFMKRTPLHNRSKTNSCWKSQIKNNMVPLATTKLQFPILGNSLGSPDMARGALPHKKKLSVWMHGLHNGTVTLTSRIVRSQVTGVYHYTLQMFNEPRVGVGLRERDR